MFRPAKPSARMFGIKVFILYLYIYYFIVTGQDTRIVKSDSSCGKHNSARKKIEKTIVQVDASIKSLGKCYYMRIRISIRIKIY